MRYTQVYMRDGGGSLLLDVEAGSFEEAARKRHHFDGPVEDCWKLDLIYCPDTGDIYNVKTGITQHVDPPFSD